MSEQRKVEEMACRELVQVINAYLDGTLPAEDRQRFDAHLEECPWCVNYLDQMRETIDALGGLEPESITPETREEIINAFAAWRGRG